MCIFKEIPPTAGFPLYAKDFLSSFSARESGDSLENDFRDYLGVDYTKVVYSGTAAFYIILESLKKISPHKTVIIPSFVCPLIPLAVERAGLKTRVCDINKDNFNFDTRRLQGLCSDTNDILAIVPVHLAGIPVDFKPVKKIAEKNKIFVIEDCAQSLGATYQGKRTGTLGEFSFFSLCRGKGLTIYEGGVIAVKNEYSGLINDTVAQLERNETFAEWLKILELFGYWIFYRPQLFWFAFRLPQIFWEWRGNNLKAAGEDFDTAFPLHKVSGFRKSIGHITFGRLNKEIDRQRQKALYYIQHLQGTAGMRIITEASGDKASYPYLTLVFDTPGQKQKAKRIFGDSGLGISQIYAHAISDYGYLKPAIGNLDCPNARYFAERHITLSTSIFLNTGELDSIVGKIRTI